MTTNSTPKDLIRRYGIRPRKSLGQSFLIDMNVLAKIVRTARIEEGDTVVEIGAGLGVMTGMIARKAGCVIALEIDKPLANVLREQLKGVPNVEIFATDVLQFDFSSFCRGMTGSKPKVIGNIPYNISTPILFHLLKARNHIDSVTVMLQKEVGERIAASPGTKAYGTLSVILSMYFRISREFTVPAGCFYPRPKVDSVVLRMAVREEPVIALRNGDFFPVLVRTALGQRRKTLINNLKISPLFRPSSEKEILHSMENLGIDANRRGETLSVEEFGHLCNALLPLIISLTGKDDSGTEITPPGSNADWDGGNRKR